ncbi:SDR family oxidoreductase [Rhodococcus sp. X156]|uniref:SDR family oxidoreductase n=1 Tax=Rhodococcus sp. X156 TaxID=2499145 RepID=UPI000FD713EC|nr:SDR family oxidoreductase [Rhodococcus sp. X156]
MDVAGKTVLITGGASGFGATAARRLATQGAQVALVDRSADAVTALAEELGGLAVVGDVSDPDTASRMVAETEERFGRLDVAFLNAGVIGGQSACDDTFDLARYRAVVGVNLDAVVFGTCAVVPALRRAGGGQVVATASLAGLVAIPGDPVYTLTKHAVVGYVRSVGAQLAGDGIAVNAICPGFADTPLIAGQRSAFTDAGFPLLTADDVVDTVEAVLASGQSAQCWYIQPGRTSEPFRFRNVPGPRAGATTAAAPPDDVMRSAHGG